MSHARQLPESIPAPQLARLRRRAFGLEYAIMTWMVAEAAIAIAAGVITASIALVGFGLDSVIELMSAGIVIWQLRGEIAGQDRQGSAVWVIGVSSSPWPPTWPPRASAAWPPASGPGSPSPAWPWPPPR
jgi:hypothetical protein